jgi:predicted O-methyltransferase YrrM
MTHGIHRAAVCALVTAVSARSYLEIGVCSGETLALIKQQGVRTVGVDIVDNRQDKEGEFHLCSSREYLENTEDRFDVVFIDASHRIEDVRADLLGSVNVLNKHGIIILHDTDPVRRALITDNGDWCGDAVKLNFEDIPGLDIVTLPVGPEGLSIARRSGETRVEEKEIRR